MTFGSVVTCSDDDTPFLQFWMLCFAGPFLIKERFEGLLEAVLVDRRKIRFRGT